MQFKVANVKVSIKIKALSLDIVQKRISDKDLFSKLHNNYLVVKSEYTFIIFKPNKSFSETHINITKIPNIDSVSLAVQEIENILDSKHFAIQIDNIIASSRFNKNLDLIKIVKTKVFDKIKYNNQKFPGLFIKFNKGTAIIFHSGKVVIVGCKNIEDIEWITKTLAANI